LYYRSDYMNSEILNPMPAQANQLAIEYFCRKCTQFLSSAHSEEITNNYSAERIGCPKLLKSCVTCAFSTISSCSETGPAFSD